MDYTTIANIVTNELTVRRSKFITTLAPVLDHKQAEAHLAKIRESHIGATHNCYGYILLPPLDEFRFSDDKEPQNTAGKPILSVLQARKLNGVLAVVTRYFGGVKLGTGGLAKAYRSAVEGALEKARIIKMLPSFIASIQLDYAASELFFKVAATKIKVLDTQYGDKVTLRFAFAKSEAKQIQETVAVITQDAEALSLQGEQYFSY